MKSIDEVLTESERIKRLCRLGHSFYRINDNYEAVDVMNNTIFIRAAQDIWPRETAALRVAVAALEEYSDVPAALDRITKILNGVEE